MKKSLFLFTLLLFFPFWGSKVFAAESAVDTYYEFGRRSNQGLVDEEDLSDEFNLSKYNIKFSQKLKKDTSFYIKYQYYNKDYDTLENLDNIFNAVGLGFDAPLYSNGDFSIKTSPDFEFKEKTYQDSKNLDYEQIKFDLPLIFKKESDWVIKILGGINSYHYPDAPKDQLKLNSKLEVSKKLFDDKLDLSAFYKLQWIDREKIADRLERTYGASVALKVDSKFLKDIETGLEQGMDNTIIYEERDDSFDYKYLNWYLKTRHEFFDKLKAIVKYTDLTRNYADFNHNYDGFMLENGWEFRAHETKDSTLDLKLAYMHKQFRYPYVSNPFSFHNNNIFSEVEFTKKDDWRVTVGSDVRFYDYQARSANDKIYYIEKIGIEKYLLKKSLVVGLDYKNTFKNFLHKADIIEDLFRLRVNYKF